MSEDKSVKDYVSKLAEDKLDELVGGRRTWVEDAEGSRWENAVTSGARGNACHRAPRYSVRPTLDEWFSEAERNGARVHRKPVADDMPLFLDRRKPKRQQYGVSIESAEDWAGVVRPEGGVVVLSDFMVTKIVDIMMRDMCDLLEKAQLIFESEDASQNVRKGFRKIVGEYVNFLDKKTGEYCDVEVE